MLNITELVTKLIETLAGVFGIALTVLRIVYYGVKALYYWHQAHSTEDVDDKSLNWGKAAGCGIRIVLIALHVGKRKMKKLK